LEDQCPAEEKEKNTKFLLTKEKKDLEKIVIRKNS